MIMLQRKVKCKFAPGTDEKFMKENLPKDKFMPVIGFEVRQRVISDNNGKKEKRDDLFYIVVGNDGRICPVASWNMVTMIDNDEKEVISMAQSIGAIASLLTSSTVDGTLNVITQK